MKKMYRLVVTDDFSRFSWVFFLATKDETSAILKTFITGIENLIDLRVKVIRCDNGTEFKNSVMNQFCEMKGSGPNWLFDIDALTKSMNYKPVVAGNQSNGSAGTKACDNLVQRILLMLDSNHQGRRKKKDVEDPWNKDCDVSSPEEPRVNQENDANEDNVVDENIVYGCADDLNMPNLEDIVYSDDDEDVGAEAGMNNLDTFIPVSPIPTKRIHKDHPVEQIIGDLEYRTSNRE
ncbi:putative ribonuclease H-like domain-containing protein [Tanacetum coccineum]